MSCISKYFVTGSSKIWIKILKLRIFKYFAQRSRQDLWRSWGILEKIFNLHERIYARFFRRSFKIPIFGNQYLEGSQRSREILKYPILRFFTKDRSCRFKYFHFHWENWWSGMGIPTEYHLLNLLCDFFMKLNVVSYRQRQSSTPDLIKTDPLQIFLAAVENSKPVIGVRGTKKGGKVYQVSHIESR